jgi:hypothetical protein
MILLVAACSGGNGSSENETKRSSAAAPTSASASTDATTTTSPPTETTEPTGPVVTPLPRGDLDVQIPPVDGFTYTPDPDLPVPWLQLALPSAQD